ncbi:hypothetical protein ACFLXB_04140 [Chloroflexota bacterium]
MDSPYKQWINVQLEPLGESVEHIEPVRTSPGSAVFSVLANDHHYYFKTCRSTRSGSGLITPW